MSEYALSNGKTLVLKQDIQPESPREWDNLGTMVCFHGRYNLGDKDHGFKHEDYTSWEDFRENAFAETDVVLPMFMMDHSGLTFRTRDFSDMGMYGHFDSGQIGFIYCTKEEIVSAFGEYTEETMQKARSALEGEVETYGQYMEGDVYGFILKDAEGDEIDSCWGFYGDNLKTNGVIDHLSDEDTEALYENNPELRPDQAA